MNKVDCARTHAYEVQRWRLDGTDDKSPMDVFGTKKNRDSHMVEQAVETFEGRGETDFTVQLLSGEIYGVVVAVDGPCREDCRFYEYLADWVHENMESEG